MDYETLKADMLVMALDYENKAAALRKAVEILKWGKDTLLPRDPKHICPHCGMDKRIRNPSGYCDHLHYPESCKTCQAMEERMKQDLKR